MLRPVFLIFAGIVLNGLGRGKTARAVFEIVGTLVIVLGIIDTVVSRGHP